MISCDIFRKNSDEDYDDDSIKCPAGQRVSSWGPKEAPFQPQHQGGDAGEGACFISPLDGVS